MSPLEYERIKLSIPTEVKERMESRLILVDGRSRSSTSPKEQVAKLMHPSNTHFLAHFKPPLSLTGLSIRKMATTSSYTTLIATGWKSSRM